MAAMKWMVAAVLLLGLTLSGCGVTAEQRQVREYEAFLKRSIGDYSTRYERYSSFATKNAAHASVQTDVGF